MTIPDYRNRTLDDIVYRELHFDSVGYVYRGLSWLDLARKTDSVCALQYAASDVRQGIEHLLFEELVLSVGGALGRKEYERCKGQATKLHKIMRRLSPDYERLLDFLQAALQAEPHALQIIKWDYKLLLKHWGALSAYLHWAGAPADTVECDEWFRVGVEVVDAAGSYIWERKTRGYSGVMLPNDMTSEIRDAWDRYRNNEIDLNGVRRIAEIARPALLARLGIRSV